MTEEFLKKLDTQQQHEIYARIIALDFNELPLEQIEGKITTGSINIDGSSAIRRTCSLTMIAEGLELTDYYWGLKTKFKLEIGLRNFVDNTQPDIIWFPQGTYAITGFNLSQSTSGYTVNITGKDKMCFLNGDLGGSLTASVDFGVEEYYDVNTNTTTYTNIPIKTIIRESVHTYAKEPYSNIIINDLDEIAVELLEYKGDVPLYLIRNDNIDKFTNYTLNGKTQVYLVTESGRTATTLEKIPKYDPRVEIAQDYTCSKVALSETDTTLYTVAKVEYGQTVGYKYTDLTYSGDLISSIGDSLTSILDKIVNMLGAYEYFYDLDGRFVFQRKKNYIQSTWNNIVKDTNGDSYATDRAYSSSVTYNFNDSNLITSYQNTPQINNLRNDFSIWGKRESASGAEIQVHYRYAIDTKPVKYTAFDRTVYLSDDEEWTEEERKDAIRVDWREIIYQMALDYYKHNQEDSYIANLVKNNPDTCADGVTGYEQYYIDLQGFWRQLYDPAPQPEYIECPVDEDNDERYVLSYFQYIDNIDDVDLDEVYVIDADNVVTSFWDSLYIEDWDNVYKNYGIVGSDNSFILITEDIKDKVNIKDLYYQDIDTPAYKHLLEELNLNLYIYYTSDNYILASDVNSLPPFNFFYTPFFTREYFNGVYVDKEFRTWNANYNIRYRLAGDSISSPPTGEGQTAIQYYQKYYKYIITKDDKYKNWTTDIIDNPATLNFWFDFLDSDSELKNFSVSNIGDRTKVVNDSDIKAIYFREVPNLIFISQAEYEASNIQYSSGYTPVFVTGNLENLFSISSQGKSAQDELDDLLYNHSYCVENITLSAIPIYHLEPNTRIAVSDKKSGIDGEYIISKISIPLTYNSTMSITATKAPDRFN